MKRVFFILSLIGIIAAFVLCNNHYVTIGAPIAILSIFCLATISKHTKFWSGFSFSLWILGAVVAALAYPDYFVSIGDFKTKVLIVPLLQIIMFGMGSQMSLHDFKGVIEMPKGVIIGVLCQFTIMPIIGFSLAMLFGFPPEIAAGIILIGASPSGMASNVMAFISKANLALSVTLTACATILSPIMTPFLMKIYASEMVSINFIEMMTGILNMVILPICAGLVFNLFALTSISTRKKIIQMVSFLGIVILKCILNNISQPEQILRTAILDALLFLGLPAIVAFIFRRYIKQNQDQLRKILSFTSMFGIAIIIVVITAAGRDGLLQVGGLLILACLLHNMLGYGLGYSISKILKLSEQDCRTIALEVGMQNGGLASGLALQMGKVASVGLAPAVFGPLMNITGSTLASWWKSKPPK